jgi:hypothetical protein
VTQHDRARVRRERGGVVGRAVVDDDDGRAQLAEDGLDDTIDAVGLVQRGDDDEQAVLGCGAQGGLLAAASAARTNEGGVAGRLVGVEVQELERVEGEAADVEAIAEAVQDQREGGREEPSWELDAA